MSALTEAERETLAEAIKCEWGGGRFRDTPWADLPPEQHERWLEEVDLLPFEVILTARLAPIEALAEQWNATPDYAPSDYDQGRVDQRHDMTGQLLEALAPAAEGDAGVGS